MFNSIGKNSGKSLEKRLEFQSFFLSKCSNFFPTPNDFLTGWDICCRVRNKTPNVFQTLLKVWSSNLETFPNVFLRFFKTFLDFLPIGDHLIPLSI